MNDLILHYDQSNGLSLNELSTLATPDSSFGYNKNKKVYYISDIHLLHHIPNTITFKDYSPEELVNKNISSNIPNDVSGFFDLLSKSINKNKEEVTRYIKQIVKNMFSDELIADIMNSYSWYRVSSPDFNKFPFYIFITGDTSSCFEISTIFYHEFRLRYEYYLYKEWKNRYVTTLNSKIYSQEELDKWYSNYLEHRQAELEKNKKKISKWLKYDKLKEKGIDNVYNYINKKKLPNYVNDLAKKIYKAECFFENDSENEEYKEQLFNQKFIRKPFLHPIIIPCVVTLGNHEIWDFSSVEEAVKSYRDMLKHEKFIFLHNEVYHTDGFDILGAVGFSKYDKKHNYVVFKTNSLQNLYVNMEKEQIIYQTDLFEKAYEKAVEDCKSEIKPLVVLTHYPISSWRKDKKIDTICTYFNGHNHRNTETEHTPIVNIYADNQIGYKKKDIRFKSTYIGLCYNPFISHEDGYYEITIDEYEAFIDYSNEKMNGTSLIENQIDKYNGKFFMVKKYGFYAFFIINHKGTKICAGGRITTISKRQDIEYFYNNFELMIFLYANMLAPFRKIQQRISEEVKKLGFDGKIHGLIVDLDFYNHIMIDPQSETLLFYYSPVYGLVKSFTTLQQLLQCDENHHLLSKLSDSMLLEMKKEKSLIISSENEISEYMGRYFCVDIKNSIYMFSNEIYKLQRIFTANTLREWNEQWTVKEDNIQELYPDIASHWDYQANKIIKPFMVSAETKRAKNKNYPMYYWICDNGHSYEADIPDMLNGIAACPKCIKKQITKKKKTN